VFVAAAAVWSCRFGAAWHPPFRELRIREYEARQSLEQARNRAPASADEE
jgi:hypothetical protein